MLSYLVWGVMKGIVLAGGNGTRLWPITRGISKQLIPIYDKPLIHYPISTLFLAGISKILIITTPDDQEMFVKLLGDGSQFGAEFSFAVQNEPTGVADAFLIGADFIDGDEVALILGDNIFYGTSFGSQLKRITGIQGAFIFAHKVSDPHRYGVVDFDQHGNVLSLEEKPAYPRSSYAVPGLYFYDSSVCEKAEKIIPSGRGEKEITSINNLYLEENRLKATMMPRGTTWFDTGTFDSLHAASGFIKIIEEREGLKISCLEEIAWRNGWISDSELLILANQYKGNPFQNYLQNLLEK